MADTEVRPLATDAPHEPLPALATKPFSPGASIVRPLAALAGIFVFIFALEVLKSGAKGLVPVLDNLSVSGPANAVGFGWLFAYVVLSGSPVAAIGVSLLAGGVFTESEAFAMVAGSRLGASFIVLAVGFVYFVTRRRNADGLYIGVVALLTTFTTQGPALLLGLVSLHYGWLDGISFHTPQGLLSLSDTVYGRWVDLLNDLLPRALVFVAGVGILLSSFAIFDRALPQLEGEAEGITRVFHFLNRRPLMFLLGCAVTFTTLSVAISITVLVPLSLKGYLKREHIIPYVMGANITTFVDTLFASVLLGGHTAFVVVLTEMFSVAAVSAVLLTVLYRPYSAGILWGASWATARPRHLAIFLAAIVAVPLFLLSL
ncbi:MAG: hypothetical protein HY875_00250 [Chloroflexi bacterium]|nr:hypothetical protein [Chloroflexota bacterium]